MISTLTTVNQAVLDELRIEMELRQVTEFLALFIFGSQFDHLLKLVYEKDGLFSIATDPRSITAEDIKELQKHGLKSIVLSGGPKSAYDSDLIFDRKILDVGVPVFGICLGFQIWAHHIGCTVTKAQHGEYDTHRLHASAISTLFADIPVDINVLQSHGDEVLASDKLFVLGSTSKTGVAAAQYKHLYGVQFHPETSATEYGHKILINFARKIGGMQQRFPAQNVAEKKIERIKREVGDEKFLILVSGGRDSTVVLGLFEKAYGHTRGQAFALYIKGVDREDDARAVQEMLADKPWITLIIVDATDEFLVALEGKTTMPEKRIAMRGVYKNVTERVLKQNSCTRVAQGTIYTDIAESGHGHEGHKKAQIKLHHNVNLNFSVPEVTPLDDCVKDGVGDIGRAIGIPEKYLTKHPFPGPGQIVRMEDEITKEKLHIVRAADAIWIEELRKENLYDSVWQAGAVLTRSTPTGTKGDGAVTGFAVCIWAVWSVNGFTAEPAEMPWAFLKRVSKRITNEVLGVVSVLYRISGKPPATIEWG